ncbi:MAG TPA: hypothetical protein VFZ09_18175 [Archangium sp.]|uniref:hypothetical protein n=1 Tax=Archangium sp. TaxID=1872627 RepID=UPI002E35162F|nr:hypothetical protein [Archangium sp.]HEX5748173.1 hypothetical protein [Archangium sp.]
MSATMKPPPARERWPLIGHISADFYGEGSSGGDFRLSGNLLVTPVRSVTFGAELLFGRRENEDCAGDTAVRLIFSTRVFY